MRSALLFFVTSVLSLASQASVAPSAQNPVQRPSSILRSAGVIRGGQAGLGFSLLGVKTEVAKSQKLQRVIVDVGNGALQAQLGAPGYFNVESSPVDHRIVINFAQTLNSRFDEKTLRKLFANSPFVKSSELMFEPEGQTISLVLQLKKQASVRVIPMSGSGRQTARLVIDLFEDSLLKAPAKKGG